GGGSAPVPHGAPVQQAGPAAGPGPHLERYGRIAQFLRVEELPRRCGARDRSVRNPEGDFRAGAQAPGCREFGDVSTPLNPRYRFDNYVVGAAHKIGPTPPRAVAEPPGAVYNPLFVYAGSGLGKTHLLMAIGHAAQEINPQVTVEYLTLDDFVEAFHAAIAAGQGDAYRRRYAEVGVLLVDDVQFLTHRREMQAELLRLTTTMLSSGRQIVLSSDRPPNEIEALDERLIQRFAGGLVIDISAPDFETRVAILRRQAEERKAQVDASVIETVAQLPLGSVRELIGA